MRPLRLGTRGSALARVQTAIVAEALRALGAGLVLEVVVITTSGDRLVGRIPIETASPPDSVKGLFTKEIEEALLRGEVDLGVHSLKDLPSTETPGLCIAAVPARGDPRDVVISRDGVPLGGLSAGGRVGTGSARRDVLVREARPDLVVEPIRGNVDTRLRKLAAGQVDALVLAAAGLIRLGREGEITEWLPPERFVPAPGQGALAIQIRADDDRVAQIIERLDDASTRTAVETERLFADRVGGGCRLPVGAYAEQRNGRLTLTGMVYDGRPIRVAVTGEADEGERLASEAAGMARASGTGR
ncbi:MAG TPA: hydroxymethylbilane synthase [bacterium]|nr:hydroxymethylbilane synthase [bacterium]